MTWLSSRYLENDGWIKTDKMTWVKENRTIIFDGGKFLLDGKKIEYIQELQATNIQIQNEIDRTNSPKQTT